MQTDHFLRVQSILKGPDARRALIMSGAVVASFVAGSAGPQMITTISDGLQMVPQAFPFMSPETSLGHWFEGGANWLATVGDGMGQWAETAGAEICARTSDALAQMRQHLGDKLSHARHIFGETISKTSEFLSLLRDTVRNSLPSTPMDAIRSIGSGLLKVAEVWGAWKTFSEISKKAIPAIRRKFGASKDVLEAAEETGLSTTEVTNININIAISGADAAEGLAEKVAEALSEARASAREIRPTHQGACDRRQERQTSFVCGGDIIWASEDFSRAMLGGVSGDALATGSTAFRPVSEIEGGIILKARLKSGKTPFDIENGHFMMDANKDINNQNSGPFLQ